MQTVLYHPTRSRVERYASGLAAAVGGALAGAAVNRVTIAFGDCSPQPAPGEEIVETVAARLVAAGCQPPVYRHFGANLGHGGGHNALFDGWAGEEQVLLLNPDTCAAPGLLSELLATMADGTVGLADARQLPLEHPKDYDRVSGDTSWASGACLMARSGAFAAMGGFDAKTFFLHGDDVDLSWRFRLGGWRVCHQPRARVFHDKRLDRNGVIVADAAERHYGLLCHLLLATKYDRPDMVQAALERFRASPDADVRAVADEFDVRRQRGELPEPLPSSRDVAQFVGGEFAPVRFRYSD